MGHYDDCYAREREEELRARKVNLEQQLADLKEFYMWRPDRKRTWLWNGEVQKLYEQMMKEIQAELYVLSRY